MAGTRPALFGIAIFLVTFLLYLFSSKNYSGNKDYAPADFFLPLAKGFLQGRLYVDKMTYYLHETVTPQEIKSGVYEDFVDGETGVYYVIYPPMPAILMMPVVLILKDSVSQTIISVFLASLIVLVAFAVFWLLELPRASCIWLTGLVSFGSIQWYHAVIGSAWYIASICSMLFLWLAILFLLKKKSLFLIGLLVGFAYLSRFAVIAGMPFFLVGTLNRWRNKGKIKFMNLFSLFAGLGICIGFQAWYNRERYGTIANLGYTLLEKRYYNITNEYSLGSYSFAYLPRHLNAMFLSLPNMVNHFPYLVPEWQAMALWLVIPAIVLVFWAPIKNRLVWGSIAAILSTAFAGHLFHGGVGATQFGYRYAMDYLPFVFLVIALAVKKNFYSWQKGLIVLSIIINAWSIYCSFWLPG